MLTCRLTNKLTIKSALLGCCLALFFLAGCQSVKRDIHAAQGKTTAPYNAKALAEKWRNNIATPPQDNDAEYYYPNQIRPLNPHKPSNWQWSPPLGTNPYPTYDPEADNPPAPPAYGSDGTDNDSEYHYPLFFDE